MPKQIDDCATAEGACPKCGHGFPVSIADLESDNNLVCPHCGAVYDAVAFGKAAELADKVLGRSEDRIPS